MNKKALRIALYFLSIVVYTVVCLFGFTHIYNKNINSNKREIIFTYPNKNIPECEKFIAYYPRVGVYTDNNIVLKSNILKSQDKREMENYYKLLKQHGSPVNDFTISFIIKDNQDVIYISKYLDNAYLESHGIEHEFYYESNLEYSFVSIVNDFYDLYGVNLNDEFLDGEISNNEGIFIGFSKNPSEEYVPYYYIIWEGKMLVLNKQ